MAWNLKDNIEKIINNNCKEIPFEGTDVDKAAILYEIMLLLKEDSQGKPKVYEFKWDAGGYGRGIMGVVATSESEAVEYAKNSSKNWHFQSINSQLLYTGEAYNLPTTIYEEYYQE